MDRDRDWVALHLAGGVGNRKKRELLEKAGGPGEIFRMTEAEVCRAVSCSADAAKSLLAAPENVADRVVQEAKRCGARILRWTDGDYPSLLKETYDPPLILFLRGEGSDLARPSVAIVGARRADRGAAAWTEEVAAVCARSGFAVVSGLAAGIDGAAHKGALAAGGRTVAVMGTGPDRIYPKEHEALAGQIEAHGALVTEFPPGTAPKAAHFPQRNRIIAGLAQAVVVIQASERSGATITARFALEANRDLFVLAGPPWDRRFAGNRRLAREGAAVVQDGEEIVLRMGGVPALIEDAPDPIVALQGGRRDLAALLLEGPRTVDQLCRDLPFSPQEVFSLLTTLELEGVIREQPGKVYTLVGAP